MDVQQDSNEIAYEQRLNDVNAFITNSIIQWNNLNEKLCKLLKNIIDNQNRINKNKNKSQSDENILLMSMDEILRDSEQIASNLSKFTSIIGRLKQIQPKMSALRELIIVSSSNSNKNIIKMRMEHIFKYLPHLIYAFEKEMAFRKNSIKDFALTNDKNVFKIIYSAWKWQLYVKDIFIHFC